MSGRHQQMSIIQQETNETGLMRSGYEVIKDRRLKRSKKLIASLDVPETNFGNISKTPQLGGFGFKTFLNMTMVMFESQMAKLLRSTFLDINTITNKPVATQNISIKEMKITEKGLRI